MQRLFKAMLWVMLAAPLAVLTHDYVSEESFLFAEVYYGGYVHLTGRIAAWLLLAALAAAPLKLAFPANRLARWYMARRRNLGVASFAYASAHLVAYLARQDGSRIAEDFVQAGFWTGWAAFVIFAALALTSNDFSVRLLRQGWKKLHRFVHGAAILVFAHWALTAFDPFLAYCHIGALALMEICRLFLIHRPRHLSAA